MVLDVFNSLPEDFAISELEELCPIISVDHIRRILSSKRKQ
ncbi:MAG: hypothetical protein AAGA16_19735 [Cyanobacteria bacterium P01_E01_bin.35]